MSDNESDTEYPIKGEEGYWNEDHEYIYTAGSGDADADYAKLLIKNDPENGCACCLYDAWSQFTCKYCGHDDCDCGCDLPSCQPECLCHEISLITGKIVESPEFTQLRKDARAALDAAKKRKREELAEAKAEIERLTKRVKQLENEI